MATNDCQVSNSDTARLEFPASGNSRAPSCATAHGACGCSRARETQPLALEKELQALRGRVESLMQQASMAEVASTALHNVSNVLNSVNVSASLVDQRVRESRVQFLGKAVAMLRENQGNLAHFLAEDPKGKMLPAYFQTLADHLQAEQTELLKELDGLHRSLDHIKEIVAVQQSYARKCGVLETLSPVELVEDALRMNSAAFERHGVEVVRDFSSTPPVTVDKHKVLQILVNLIRNAKYAMDEHADSQKVLTLQVRPATDSKLMIRVRDTGVGIAPENLARIFEHGFTTKRDGHGFGLHSGLVAAAEMGGKLTAQSDGAGKGATFSLELPFEQSAKDAHGPGHASK